MNVEKQYNLSKTNRMTNLPEGARHCKCSVTGYWGNTDLFFCPQKELGLDDKKNVYYKNIKTWELEMSWKKWRNDTLGFFAKRILGYSPNNYLGIRTLSRFKNINEIEDQGIESGIPFKSIHSFLEDNERMIVDALERIESGSGFKSNLHKESYAMAVVEDRVFQYYENQVKKQEQEKRIEMVNRTTQDDIEMRKVQPKTKNDISQWIE